MRTQSLGWVAAVLLAAATASAQTNPTGTLSGKISDPQGLAIPGVTVTAQSPALQGSRSAVSSANGDYILPFLPPGEYTVTFELTGFATIKRDARITLSQTTTINAGLTVSTQTETITVVGQASGDFNQGPTVATSFKQELNEKLPLNRTFQALVALTPGVQSSGPQGAVSISGAASFENLFMINGVTVQDNLRNTPFSLFIEDALQETTTSTATISAEFGRFSGGVVNAITKSGGNDFSGSVRMTFDNDKWTALTPFANDRRTDKLIPTYEATLGGPIVRDRLWFFGATRLRDTKETRTTGFTNLSYPRELDEKRYEGKLTFSPSANHTFKGAYTHIASEEIGNSFGTIMDLASLANRKTPQRLLSLNYTGVLSPKFFVELQYSLRKFTFQGSGSLFTDLQRGTLLLDRSRANARYNSPTFCGVCDDEKRDNNNIVAKASYFLSTGSAGSHNLVAGFDLFDDKRFSNNHQSGSDFRIFTTGAILGSNGTVFPVINNDRTTFIRWTPIFASSEGNRFRTYSGFLNDAWTLDQHWRFNLGVRYDKNSGADSLGNTVVKDSAISPRLAATFDPKGDGTWTVNASYGQYVAAIANGVGDSASSGGQPATIDFDYLGPTVNLGSPANPIASGPAIDTVFNWFNANGGTNRPVRGTPSIPGVTQRISDGLKSPSAREFTLGVSRRLGSRGLIRVDGVYRKFGDFYSDRTDTTTGRNTDRFGRAFDLTITENTDAVERRYKGITTQLSYRLDDRLNLGGNYTLSRTYGTFNGETGANGPIRSSVANFPEYFNTAWGTSTASGGGGPEGDLASDVRHKLRLWATWDAPLPSQFGRVSIGVLQFFNSGAPYGAVGNVDSRPYVTNPGYLNPPATVEYFFTARDAFRTEKLHRTDLSLNYGLRLGWKRSELFFRSTLLNVFNRQAITNFTDGGCGTGGCISTAVSTRNNSSTLVAFNPFTTAPVEGVHWAKGSTFGQPTSRFAYQTPRTLSFSVGMRF